MFEPVADAASLTAGVMSDPVYLDAAELRPRKVLAVDDHPTNLRLIQKIISQMGHEVLLAHSGQEGLEMARTQHPDLILLDIMMPDLDGYEVSRQLKENPGTTDIPIIFVTAKDQIEDKITAIELGAVDYIAKPIDKEELRVRVAIIIEMVKMQEQLLAKAYSDELTGLTNRRRFLEMLEREVLLAKAHGKPLSLIVLDIDFFKKFNDTYGHLGGDYVLRELASILKENVRPLDVVARYGGEEFCVLMPNTSTEEGVRAGERLRTKVKEHQWRIASEFPRVTISLGLDSIDANGICSPEELLKSADAALYAAKAQGRDRLIRWDHIDITKEDLPLQYDEYIEIQQQIANWSSRIRVQAAEDLGGLIKEKMQSREPYAVDHFDNVCQYAFGIMDELGLDIEFRDKLMVASRLYNLGRVSIPKNVLNKETELTPHERQIVQQLPLLSLKLLEPMRGIYGEEFPIIRHRCEHFDGTGFPDGLHGCDIPIGARILAVAISFDAITSERPYHHASTLQEGLQEIKECAGRVFDPEVVDAFCAAAAKHIDDWPLKSLHKVPLEVPAGQD